MLLSPMLNQNHEYDQKQENNLISIIYWPLCMMTIYNKINFSIFYQSHKKMRKRQSTITEQYSPTIRRRLKTNYLGLSLPGAFKLIEVDHEQSHPPEPDTKIQEKLMEKVKENYDKFMENHQRIHSIIDEVDDIIRKRMEAHEEGLLSVVKTQIDKMQGECKRVVEQYNRMIQQKNKETEIYNLKNELEYFRHAAHEYYTHNKKLREENKQLRILVKNKDSIIEQLNGAVQKAAKKYLKAKAIEERKSKEQQQILERKISDFLQQTPRLTEKMKIRQEFSIVRDPSLQLQTELKREKSLNSHRYSAHKHHISSNMTKTKAQKRLLTEMPSTAFNQEYQVATMNSMKGKNSTKSKSFWKFEGRT